MKNKLVVIINSLKYQKLKKNLLYEMKFLVPNYSCLQNPWIGGYRPKIPVLCPLSSTEFVEPPPWKKFLGTPLNTLNYNFKTQSFKNSYFQIILWRSLSRLQCMSTTCWKLNFACNVTFEAPNAEYKTMYFLNKRRQIMFIQGSSVSLLKTEQTYHINL
jgi:hypothetical protein